MTADGMAASEVDPERPIGVVHIAAQVIDVGPQMRQRCAWCGALLIDMDLSTVMMVGKWENPAGWSPGALVGISDEGGMSWLVEHEDGAQLPANACGQLDHEVTR